MKFTFSDKVSISPIGGYSITEKWYKTCYKNFEGRIKCPICLAIAQGENEHVEARQEDRHEEVHGPRDHDQGGGQEGHEEDGLEEDLEVGHQRRLLSSL